MKTIENFRKYFPVVTIALFLLASNIEAGAQNRNNHKKGNERTKDKKEYKQSDRSGERTANKEWRDDRTESNRDYRNYENRDNRDGNHQKYSKKNNYAQRNYFNHPKYGKVYQRFDHNPVVFRHSHGNYYYSGNNFYSYQRAVGYYVVEPPRQVYFRDLPFRCERVYSQGHEYYRNGDLFFSYSPRGYVIVPSPFQANLFVRF